MSRQCITHPYISVGAVGSVLGTDGSYIPNYKPGQVVICDSGEYVYGSANGAVAENYLCKYVEGVWDFDTITHTEGDTAHCLLGVCVASGGLADNQWGWFWLGKGSELVYIKSSVASADTQLLLCTTAGQVDDSTDGTDVIHDLFNVAAAAGTAAALCYSSVRLSVNASITN